jgi:hypothetical protein
VLVSVSVEDVSSVELESPLLPQAVNRENITIYGAISLGFAVFDIN